jgi:hypothetical protein
MMEFKSQLKIAEFNTLHQSSTEFIGGGLYTEERFFYFGGSENETSILQAEVAVYSVIVD